MMNKKDIFGKIPPRIVIHEILSFVTIHTEYTRGLGEFGAFGYFKKDYFRHIWFLFSSVEIGNPTLQEVRIDLKRLIHVRIQNDAPLEVTKKIISCSSQMRLKKLEILIYFEHQNLLQIQFLIDGLFSKKGAHFPSLESLYVYDENDDHPFDISKWCENENCFWKNLKEFDIFCGGGIRNFDKVIALPGALSNIVSLSMFDVKFSSDVILRLPKIEILKLKSCDNLKIIPGSKLREVEVENVMIAKKLFQEVENIPIFSLVGEVTDIFNEELLWFGKSELSKVTKKLSLENVHGIKSPFVFSETIQIIELDSCENIRETVFSHPTNPNLSTSLRELFLVNCQFGDDDNHSLIFSRWKFCDNLRVLKIHETKLPENFFSINTWSNLEVLKISLLSLEEKNKWNPMPKLKKFKISIISICSYLLFRGNEIIDRPLNSLVHLSLKEFGDSYFPKLISRLKKNSFEHDIYFNKNLKVLNLRNILKLTDECFRNHDFGSLERLSIEYRDATSSSMKDHLSSSMKGENWAPMDNLVNIIFSELSNFGDYFFQEQSLTKLKSLDLSRMKLLHGKKWKIATTNNSLKELQVIECGCFDDPFFSQYLNIVEDLYFKKCQNLTCLNWNVNMNKLSDLMVHSCEKLHIDQLLSNSISSINKKINSNASSNLRRVEIVKIDFQQCPQFTGCSSTGCDEQKFENILVFERCVEFRIQNCANLKNDFFEHNIFPILRNLRIGLCHLITGKNWNPSLLDNLKDLRILDDCSSIGDELFQTDGLKTVRVIIIEGNTPKIQCVNWSFKKGLKRLEMKSFRRSKFSEGVFPFPKDCKTSFQV